MDSQANIIFQIINAHSDLKDNNGKKINTLDNLVNEAEKGNIESYITVLSGLLRLVDELDLILIGYITKSI